MPKTENPQDIRQNTLVSDIEAVVRQIQANRERFNLVSDEDLVDALIYEHNALQAQYRYLLKCARGPQV